MKALMSTYDKTGVVEFCARRALTSARRTFVRGGGGVFPLSPRVRNIGFALFITGILAYGAALAAHMLASFDLVNLLRDVTFDDSFYYFQIAANLAEGKFSTFDGGITRTNGYHPLWMLMITPFYWFSDRETALFAIKAFEIMLVAGAVALIAVAARLAKLPWILLFALPPLLYRHHGLIAGMEAAAALFTLGLLFAALTLYARNPARWKWALAAVAFALPWARLEYVAISLAATGAMLFIEWSRRWRTNGASPWRSLLSLDLIAPPLGAIAGILVYFAYNGIVFGGIVPVSGATRQMWSQIRFENEGGYDLAQNFRDVLQIPVFDYELPVTLAICVCLPMVWWLSRRCRSREDWLLLAFLAGAFSLAAGHLAKFTHTVITAHPSEADHSWYFVPAYLSMALIVPLACYVAIYFIRRLIEKRSRATASILSVGIVAAGAVYLLLQANFADPFRSIDWAHAVRSNISNINLSNYAGMLVMNRALPSGSVIGVWDSGEVGYFSDFPVVNLDGLANDYDFLRQYSEPKMYGGGVFILEDYASTLHQRFGITYYANIRPIPIEPNFNDPLYQSAVRWIRYNQHWAFQLWPFEPLEEVQPAEWFWERMEPHFDYRSNGASVIVDGRLAQAFARDCAANELAAWSWADIGGKSLDAEPWTLTQTGLCVSAIVLPHDALLPVRVESMSAGEYKASLIGDNPPAIRSGFDVYMDRERSKLIYSRDDCADGDAAPAFFLHIYPVDASDLPAWRKQYGFDNLDFRFEAHGFTDGESCFAILDLPHYNFTAIRTGQYIPGEGRIWEGEIHLGE